MHCHFTLLATLLLFPMQAFANSAECDVALSFSTDELLSGLSSTQKAEALDTLVWSEERDLLAYCYEMTCFAVRTCRPEPLVIDISPVIYGNLGKIGWKPSYERIENRPLRISSEVRTLSTTNRTIIEVSVQTRIWKDEQRYTVSERLVIVDNKPRYR